MQHLRTEDLARLVDEAPDASEAEHLMQCAVCRDTLAALRGDAAALRGLPDLLPPPPDAWPKIAERLRDERLIRAPTHPVPISRRRGWTRYVAGIVLFVLGSMFGSIVQTLWTSAGSEPDSQLPRIDLASPYQAPDEGSSSALTQALQEADAAYHAALPGHATPLPATEGGADTKARLAALEEIVTTTRAALSAAPADPIINGYHLTALAQREATMREIALDADGRWF